MKKLITYIGLLFLMLSTSLISSSDINVDNPNSIYYHFGTFVFPHKSLPNTETSFDIWITKEYMSGHENQKSYIIYEFKYKVFAISKSLYYNQGKNTFMEGFKIYINGNDQSMNNMPLNQYIQKYPTMLYEIKSNDQNPSFDLSWDRSYYDARN